MAEYGTIWTRTGRNKEANNLAGGPRITLTHLAVGDGNGAAYEPSDAMTALAREVWRGGVTRLEVDANNPAYVIVEAIIPTNIGGWTVREAGLFDDAGDLIVITKMPETYKPQLAEGAGKELLVRIIIEKTSAESTPIRIDPAIATASRAYVDREIVEVKGLVAAEAAARQDHEADATAHGSLPIGGIIMWSGAIEAVPQGWALCDGQNGTPDLRDRFIVGAGGSYAVCSTGGSLVTQVRTLTTAQMPSHGHTCAASSRDHEGSGSFGGNSGGGEFNLGTNASGSGQGHSHDYAPPYYALCFIMKL
ncbi:phage tail protein [Desulfocurvibacter africanus]|uniref:phage tail-collar fiber domain-containing protein n=1 Tax=Desulfocurvibacter africanus TaxID=873 RepID=UPI002FDB46A1